MVERLSPVFPPLFIRDLGALRGQKIPSTEGEEEVAREGRELARMGESRRVEKWLEAKYALALEGLAI